jgi:hypothetical protein
VRFHHFDFFQKGTRQGNGAAQRRANCPLQAVFVKTVPKRVPEMASARRSYGNDKCARSGDEKHMIYDISGLGLRSINAAFGHNIRQTLSF